VMEENEKFKHEIRAELQGTSFQAATVDPTLNHFSATSSSSLPPVVSSAPFSGGSSSSSVPTDFQTQMLAVLNNTFSQLSTVISDTSSILLDAKSAMTESKSSEIKSDWIKFSGDSKKFRSWYLAVMAQLSIAPWLELYDTATNSVVNTTSNVVLNGKLYAKVVGALEGNALQHILNRKHLRGNGILLLHELHQIYKPKCVPEVIAAKTAEFWGQTIRSPSESVDDYFNRFQELLDEINEEVETIPIKNAIRQFLFTLGPEFEPVQMNYRLGTLASDWKTEDWPMLLVLCRDFYNSVNPKGPNVKRERERDPFVEFQVDRASHHKKIRNWLMNPSRYKSELEAEQRKYSGRCIYHLTTNHATQNCNVKKDCDKQIASKRPQGGASNSQLSGSTQSVLRHMTEEVFEDAVDQTEDHDESSNHFTNDTNESDLLYFARVSKHYLRLVRNDTCIPDNPGHNTNYPIILDSGANFHMFRERDFFTTLSPATGKVILGDGKTSLPILGVGTVTCTIGSQVLTIENVRYVPTLSESIYSLFIRVQLPNHGIKSSFDQGLFLEFPNFQTKAIIGMHDLFLDALPLPENITKQQLSSNAQYSTEVCHHISNFQQDVLHETDHLDHLLFSLRQYYATIKTKRQLQLGTPAGFRQLSQHQKLYLLHGQDKQNLDEESLSLASSDTSMSPETLHPGTSLNMPLPTTFVNPLDASVSSDNTNCPNILLLLLLFDPWINHHRLFRL